MTRNFYRLLLILGFVALVYILFFGGEKEDLHFSNAESRQTFDNVVEANNNALADFKKNLPDRIQPYFNAAATNGIIDFRKEIGSFKFMKNFVCHWNSKEKFIAEVIAHDVGAYCECGLDEADKTYKEYCGILEKNTQNYVKKIYGEELEFDHASDVETFEAYRKDLRTLFEDVNLKTKSNIHSDMINAGTLPLMLDDIKVAVGATTATELGRGISIYIVAKELFNYFVERPKKLDKIADVLRCDVYDYYDNVKHEYTTAAEAQCKEINELLKKMAIEQNKN